MGETGGGGDTAYRNSILSAYFSVNLKLLQKNKAYEFTKKYFQNYL